MSCDRDHHYATVFQMSDYSLGHSAAEQERLQRQAGYLRGITESIWRSAGIAPGLQVLDVGCGVGDTTFLAADLVGPGGFVIGMDRSTDAIATARQRAETDGRTNVLFVQGELGSPVPGRGPFDAVVGRYVLVHQRDIPAALRSLHALVRPGGLVAFHELELDLRFVSDPSSDLAQRVYFWLREACRLGGMQLNVVSQMPRYFCEAGLGWPETAIHPLVGCGADSFGPGYVVSTLSSIAPLLVKAGVVTEDELGIDTLEARLRESCANGAPSMAQINSGVWVRRT
jgi:ubiquinone/menaquinone biosynthesis C-methylase UbiE